ncbi:MAG: hypothetical protein NT084_10630 [Bacteroidetes bacterium]|nr:hypothetical protein [Bacteroidota bacterium]
MLVQKYNPTLTDLLKVDSLPPNLGFLQAPLSTILDKLFYQNLQSFKRKDGASASYTLDIITYKKITLLQIPGTGIAFVVNPSALPNIPNASVFNVSFEYTWEILKYVRNANLQSFGFDIRSYLNLLGSIFGITEAQFLSETIVVFLGDFNNPVQNQDPLQDFATKYNSNHTNQLSYTPNSTTFQQLYSQLQSFGENVIQLIIDDYLDNVFDKLKILIGKFIGPLDEEGLKDLLLPQFRASINNIAFGIEFPQTVFIPIDSQTNLPTTDPDILTTVIVNAGSFSYDTKSGFLFEKNLTFTFPKSDILGSGFTLDVQGLKIDLSETRNIPEADADGRPADFKGVYIKEGTIGFPAFWNHDPSANGPSTGEIKARNLLCGTGGISGTLSLEAKQNVNTAPLIQAKFGSGFSIELDAFDITFQQNAIVGSNIHGKMIIPGFNDDNDQPAAIFLDIHIGTGSEFQATASVTQAITALRIPHVLDLKIKSLFLGRNESGKFYVGVSGNVDFMPQGNLGQFLPQDIELKSLIIYDDGTYEIQGGGIVFPKAYTFQLGPAKLSITAIHLGSHEQEHTNTNTLLPELRKYKYFGFDGGVSVNPGGVDARGKGVKFYFTVDDDIPNGRERHFFFRIQSLAIDIILPSGATEKEATTVIHGFLAMKDPTPPQPENSTEYAGSVSFKIPMLKGLEGAAAMRFNPGVPSFILDIDLELSAPIVLGATGLGIYGFRALFGRKYVASKSAVIGLTDDSEWWQYYKASIGESFHEGIHVEKFLPKDGLSLGAGVSLATATDSGKTFSTKLFLLLSMPDVFLFQGQAQLLKKRIGLDTNPDPPFFALIAITHQSVEAAFGVDYKVPDDGAQIGKTVTVAGVTEMGFFFGNSTAWYVNIGRDTPAERRIQARVFDIFNMYFYLMMSSSGIKAGAGASFAQSKKFGPLRAELSAFLDTAGKISFHPKQIGGSVNLGGNVGLYIFKFGFSISVNAGLAGEASKPRIVTGTLEVCIKVLKKEYCADFELTWNFDNNLNFTPVDLIEPSTVQEAGKTNNILTSETLNLYGLAFAGAITNSQIPVPSNWAGGANSYIVPLDSYIDLEFKKGMDVSSPALSKFGGVSTGSNFVDYIAPQRAKSDQVRHEYKANNIEILYFDSNNPASGNWQAYDFYQALTPQQLASFVNQTVLQNLKYGYWQIDQPGKYNKLRVLAQDPLSFIKSGTLPEDFGVTDQTIFCGETPRAKTCIDFTDKSALPSIIPKDKLLFYKGVMVRLNGHDAMVIPFPFQNFQNALSILDMDFVEIYFNEPSACVQFVAQTFAPFVTVSYYKRDTIDPADINSLPTYSYSLIRTDDIAASALSSPVVYMDALNCVDKMVIKANICPLPPVVPIGTLPLYCTIGGTSYLGNLTTFLDLMIKFHHLTPNPVFIYPNNALVYNGVFMNTPLYNKPLNATDQIIKTVDVNSATQLQFTITDNTGYSCTFNLQLQSPIAGFNWNNLNSIFNVRPNPTGQVAGNNYDFLADVSYFGGGGIFTTTIKITTCYPSNVCSTDCSTLLYSFCFQNLEDFLYNQTIPSQSQVQQNAQQMVDALTQTLQPVWRPNTHYAIKVEVLDTMYQQASGSPASVPNNPFLNSFLFCFKTAGPVGHYHEFPTTADTEIPRTDFLALQNKDREAEFQLLTLNLYIDYPKCYPNADGDLINAKPLFYKTLRQLIPLLMYL